MVISSAKYITHPLASPPRNGGVKAIFDGVELNVPLDPANRHYAEILRQVAAGTLTIADAD